MRAIILFDTLFGNTERIACSLRAGLEEKLGVEVPLANIKMIDAKELEGFDLLILGAPTQYLTASKTMKQFLEQLKDVNLKGKYGFAFDTKLDSRLSGSAAKFIERKLKEYGVQIIYPRTSAIVLSSKEKTGQASETVLKEGMEDQFKLIGFKIHTIVQKMAGVSIS